MGQTAGVVADRIVTDIAGYRSGGARLHYRLIGVIWRFGDYTLIWIVSGLPTNADGAAAALPTMPFRSRRERRLGEFPSRGPEQQAAPPSRSEHVGNQRLNACFVGRVFVGKGACQEAFLLVQLYPKADHEQR